MPEMKWSLVLPETLRAGVFQSIREQITTTFTQEDINQGKITYQQQAAGRTNDSLLLEATNGLTKVGPVRLEVDVVPAILPLQVHSPDSSKKSKEEQGAAANSPAG